MLIGVYEHFDVPANGRLSLLNNVWMVFFFFVKIALNIFRLRTMRFDMYLLFFGRFAVWDLYKENH